MLAANPHLGPRTWCFPDTTCLFSQTCRAPPVPVPLGYNVLFQGFTWFHVYLLSLSHVCDGAFANTEELSTWTPGRCGPRSKMEERGLAEVSVMYYTFKRRLKDKAVNRSSLHERDTSAFSENSHICFICFSKQCVGTGTGCIPILKMRQPRPE